MKAYDLLIEECELCADSRSRLSEVLSSLTSTDKSVVGSQEGSATTPTTPLTSTASTVTSTTLTTDGTTPSRPANAAETKHLEAHPAPEKTHNRTLGESDNQSKGAQFEVCTVLAMLDIIDNCSLPALCFIHKL